MFDRVLNTPQIPSHKLKPNSMMLKKNVVRHFTARTLKAKDTKSENRKGEGTNIGNDMGESMVKKHQQEYCENIANGPRSLLRPRRRYEGFE